MISRRGFLGTLALALAGCNQLVDRVAQPDIPDVLKPPGGANRHPIAHLLNRAAYGARPGQIEQVEKIGRENWIAQQLDFRSIDDDKLKFRLNHFETLNMPPVDVLSFGGDKNFITEELAVATLVRAVYSERQLFEVMVGFWNDHFSMYHFKEEVTMLKTVDDREVIRKHALGKFGDLLRASAHSPAMLRYLDNTQNEKSHPNENYAREIMELHTLGVEGGYTEQDIQEVARCLTGWTITTQGAFSFNSEWHDTGEKTVLGQTIPAEGGKEDGDRVLDILIHHPSTAQFVCAKLVRRLVADDPPVAIVDACVQTWRGTDGDLREIVKTILTHPLFDSAAPKLKRPYELLVSLMRAFNARYDTNPELVVLLDRLGQRPFGWTTPDGYPDTAEKWSGNMLGRWNLALDMIHNKLPGVEIDVIDIAERGKVDQDANALLAFFGRLLLGRDLNTQEQAALWQFALGKNGEVPDLKKEQGRQQMIQTLGLLVASPGFQWR